MKIIYIHHGERKKGNPPNNNDDLTKLGYKDCKLVSDLVCNLNAERIRAIYASPFFRCKKTAEIINKNLKLPIFYDERLNEMGSVKGESWLELQTRVMSFIDEMIKMHESHDVIICVTSGVNIVGFINRAYNLLPNQNAPYLGVPSCSPIVFEY